MFAQQKNMTRGPTGSMLHLQKKTPDNKEIGKRESQVLHSMVSFPLLGFLQKFTALHMNMEPKKQPFVVLLRALLLGSMSICREVCCWFPRSVAGCLWGWARHMELDRLGRIDKTPNRIFGQFALPTSK